MDLFFEIKKEKKISKSNFDLLQHIYGDMLFKALEFLEIEGPRINLHIFHPSELKLWTVQGTDWDHIVFPELFCDCTDFLLNSIYRKREFRYCKHLLAQKLGFALDRYYSIDYNDDQYGDWQKTHLKIRQKLT